MLQLCGVLFLCGLLKLSGLLNIFFPLNLIISIERDSVRVCFVCVCVCARACACVCLCVRSISAAEWQKLAEFLVHKTMMFW